MGMLRNANFLITIWKFCLLSVLLHKVIAISSTLIDVETTNGWVRGISAKSREGKPYHQFLGIPYAKNPTGNLRFECPQKPDNWTGIKEVTHFQKPCIQFEVMFIARVLGTENCLFLNIFTPNVRVPESRQLQAPEKLLPVMVFIHGGFFMSGNPSMYKGKYFMDESVVLVTFSYRLGSFGFLSTGDEHIRGNMGLKDQNLALQWVRDNIKNFGGDPSRVTLFGESSGGVSVHLHMMGPLSKGLFHRAISESGSALRKYHINNNFLGQATYLASKFGCPTRNITEMVKCLKYVDARAIAEVHKEAQNPHPPEFATYGPVVEAIKDENAFLIEEPLDSLRNGNFMKVPWLTGVNSADGILFSTRLNQDQELSRSLENYRIWEEKLPRLLRYDSEGLRGREAAIKIRNFYFGNKSPTGIESFQNLTNMFSDRMYNLPVHQAAQLQAVHSPVYLYYFDYKTMISVLKLAEAVHRSSRILPAEVQIARFFVQRWFEENVLGMVPPFYGAAHADELFLLFNVNFLLEARIGTPDYDASRALVKLWADFAKNNESDTVKFNDRAWPPLTANDASIPYIRFGEGGRLSVISEPFEERMNFWKSLNLTQFEIPI